MAFRITGLSADPFRSLYGLPDIELESRGVRRYVADKSPGFPDRIEMRDVEPGETLLLLNHVSQAANTPYRASHAIFILEGATKTYSKVNQIPQVLYARTQSLRGFDAGGMMLEADLADGADSIVAVIERLFTNADIAYIHTHNAKQGCYAGRIDRV